MSKRWVVLIATGAAALLTLAWIQTQESSQDEATDVAGAEAPTTVQPIAFPHSVHAGQDQIDCQYCHFSAERSVDAGMPPVATCWGCHQVIRGTTSQQQTEIAKVVGYWERQEAIPWVRVYKVRDHVRFPHLRHVAAQVDCAECHGDVAEMVAPIEEPAQRLAMGWCVSCHKAQEVSRDCAVCHY
ncbi:MAG: cytochrome c3 family protein [Longimicrobiales bacterium]